MTTFPRLALAAALVTLAACSSSSDTPAREATTDPPETTAPVVTTLPPATTTPVVTTAPPTSPPATTAAAPTTDPDSHDPSVSPPVDVIAGVVDTSRRVGVLDADAQPATAMMTELAAARFGGYDTASALSRAGVDRAPFVMVADGVVGALKAQYNVSTDAAVPDTFTQTVTWWLNGTGIDAAAVADAAAELARVELGFDTASVVESTTADGDTARGVVVDDFSAEGIQSLSIIVQDWQRNGEAWIIVDILTSGTASAGIAGLSPVVTTIQADVTADIEATWPTAALTTTLVRVEDLAGFTVFTSESAYTIPVADGAEAATVNGEVAAAMTELYSFPAVDVAGSEPLGASMENGGINYRTFYSEYSNALQLTITLVSNQ